MLYPFLYQIISKNEYLDVIVNVDVPPLLEVRVLEERVAEFVDISQLVLQHHIFDANSILIEIRWIPVEFLDRYTDEHRFTGSQNATGRIGQDARHGVALDGEGDVMGRVVLDHHVVRDVVEVKRRVEDELVARVELQGAGAAGRRRPAITVTNEAFSTYSGPFQCQFSIAVHSTDQWQPNAELEMPL